MGSYGGVVVSPTLIREGISAGISPRLFPRSRTHYSSPSFTRITHGFDLRTIGMLCDSSQRFTASSRNDLKRIVQ